jgi:hypothetical protein
VPRLRHLCVLCLAAAAAGAVADPAGRAGHDPNRDRALASYAAMQRFFHHGNVYAETSFRRGWTPSHAWPFSQALAATLAVAPTSDVRRRLGELERYWNPSSAPAGYDSVVRPPGGAQFYDDNEWIGLSLIDAYRLLGRPRDLLRARRLFGLVVHGWDREDAHACPGGVFWTRAASPDHRNTVSTANGALLALEIYDLTHARGYLAWAERMADWVQRCLRAPGDLFWDHVDSKGEPDPTEWSYNQGAMIGVDALLYRATGDTSYLVDAQHIAAAAVAHFRTRVDEEPPFFLAIFFRNLLLLERIDPQTSYRDFVGEYASDAWTHLRDPRTGLFRFEPGRPVQLLEQAAMVQIYAYLAA